MSNNVMVGEVWEDTNPRKPRSLLILSVTATHARCENRTTGRTTWILLGRFNDRYKLVE